MKLPERSKSNRGTVVASFALAAYEGDQLVEIVEFDAEDRTIARTNNEPESRDHTLIEEPPP